MKHVDHNKPSLWMVGPLSPALRQGLEKKFTLIEGWTLESGTPEHEALSKNVRIVATTGRFGATRELMASLPALEAIVSFGVGYDSIDIQAAKERGIMVSNTPDVLDACVADAAFALLLAVSRRICVADTFVRQGAWLQQEFGLASSVAAKRCGILGLGNIGMQIAKRAQGFDMQIHYCNRTPRPDTPADYIYHADVQSLAEQVDFLVLALPGGQHTRHIVDMTVLKALGANGYLINVARGTVVNEQDLVLALQQGVIAGAGLDVYEHEPQVPEALLAMENVVLLPHIGSGTRETRQAMADLVLKNAESWLEKGVLATPLV